MDQALLDAKYLLDDAVKYGSNLHQPNGTLGGKMVTSIQAYVDIIDNYNMQVDDVEAAEGLIDFINAAVAAPGSNGHLTSILLDRLRTFTKSYLASIKQQRGDAD
ncbi:uncharacterized protein LOC113296415 [Papaver somniferum]|uniref:uncharacterized protein LOC113296415 n=1 Tax=Papaver somniferum TaxID=3469 RepID=UPI000E70412B|nr:uncharacterized protein LOC113296415 [Papaver somniferum]